MLRVHVCVRERKREKIRALCRHKLCKTVLSPCEKNVTLSDNECAGGVNCSES